MKYPKHFLLFVVVLLTCSFLVVFFFQTLVDAPIPVMASKPATGELTAIDVSLDAEPVLERLGIFYQDQPRFGFWRAAATTDQLILLKQEGISYDVVGQVAIVEAGSDQENQSSSIDAIYCTGNNPGDYFILSDWVYDPLFTNCSGTTTVTSIDISYDVIHPWADNALKLVFGSNSPSWFYVNLEEWDSCTQPASTDWHKYRYNITAFNGRPVNQRWDLVARDDCPSGPKGYIDNWSIWVYYISTSPMPAPGAAYLSPQIIVSASDRNEYKPAIAYNSNHDEYLVVYESVGPGGYSDVYAQRVSGNGTLLSWFAVGSLPNAKREPAVAYDQVNDRYFVVWLYDYYGDGRDWDVYGRFIPWYGPDPGISDTSIESLSSNQAHPEIAYGYAQQEFMVVYMNSSPGSATSISGRNVFANGISMRDRFEVTSGVENQDHPDVTYNLARNEFLVVWDIEIIAGDRDIYGRRFEGNSTPIGDGFIISDYIGSDENRPSVACNQFDQYLVAWQSDQGSAGTQYAIYARYLNGDAIKDNIYLIDSYSDKQINPDVSCKASGNQCLVAWQRGNVIDKYGVWARITYRNQAMSPAFELIYPGNDIEDRLYPAIGSGRTSYLVAWEHQRSNGNFDIYGRLLRYQVFMPLSRK